MYTIGFESATVQHKGGDVPCPDVLELDDQFILKLSPLGVVLDGIEIEVAVNYLTLIAKRTPVSAGSIESHISHKVRSHKTEVRSSKEVTIK